MHIRIKCRDLGLMILRQQLTFLDFTADIEKSLNGLVESVQSNRRGENEALHHLNCLAYFCDVLFKLSLSQKTCRTFEQFLLWYATRNKAKQYPAATVEWRSERSHWCSVHQTCRLSCLNSLFTLANIWLESSLTCSVISQIPIVETRRHLFIAKQSWNRCHWEFLTRPLSSRPRPQPWRWRPRLRPQYPSSTPQPLTQRRQKDGFTLLEFWNIPKPSTSWIFMN